MPPLSYVLHCKMERAKELLRDQTCSVRQAGIEVQVIPVTTSEYGLSKAKRPFNSRLDKSKLTRNGFERLPDWKDALARYLAATATN